MTVQDYVSAGRKKFEYGLTHYHMPKPPNLDSHLFKKIQKGKKTTYIDEAVKRSRNMPDFNYNITTDILDKKRKSS